MTRRVGQVTTRGAVLGFALAVGLVVTIVQGLSLLLIPAELEPALDAAVRAEADGEPLDPCPQRLGAQRLGALQAVTSNDLVDCATTFDGRTVRYTGEVVGAVLLRGDRAWVQLNDDVYARSIGPLPAHRVAVGGNAGVAVSIPATLARQIGKVGGHNAQGDLVEVSGVYRSADPADGGGPAIQARSGRIVRAGEQVRHPLSVPRAAVAVALALATTCLAIYTYRLRRRPR
jgi:hypothetical protein